MLDFFYNLIIYPLVIMYNLVFHFINDVVLVEDSFIPYQIIDNRYIVSIILLSIFVNILTYNLYKKADELQEKTRKKKEGMNKWVAHIKKNFKGDERFFILSAYYKENNYKPMDQFKESLSLLLQIPFFAAAYIFFHSEIDIGDITQLDGLYLNTEDKMLMIGDVTLNVLPIIMTIINIVSAIIYTKGQPIKQKIQAFALPIVFLVILYHSPAGLVLYWTCNNLISLIKIIFLKLKKKKEKNQNDNREINAIYKWIISACVVFVGVVIPSLVVSSSPLDFLSSNYNQLTFIISTFIVFLGAGLWISVIYYFSDNKKIFIILLFSICVYMIINHILYLNTLGVLTLELKYDLYINTYNSKDVLRNIGYFVLALIITIILSKRTKIIYLLSKTLCFVFIALSLFNIVSIEKTVITNRIEAKERANRQEKEHVVTSDGSTPVANISKKGRNVIMICLDRFIARYYPYAVEVVPKIKEQFEGFTIYENTLSFGKKTMVAAPAMYGGYEYTVYEMNKREGTVKEKMAEAYSIVPKILSSEGYDVTVSGIPYEGETGLSYATYSNIKKAAIAPKSDLIDNNLNDTKNRIKRNFIYYSIMKVNPIWLKDYIYSDGEYLYNPPGEFYKNSYSLLFLDSFVILNKLNNLFNVVDDNSNNAFIMHNDTTHEPCVLEMPDFYPSEKGTNEMIKRIDLVVDGMEFKGNYDHLNVTIASLIQVGNFLDYLKENKVYDNTRIIIVGDHGHVYENWDKINVVEETNINNYDNKYGEGNKMAKCYPQYYNPILMYKDFDSNVYSESSEFMTNADTTYLLLNGISKTMENPYTGNKISMDYKYDNDEYHIINRNWDGNEEYIIRNNKVIESNEGYWLTFTGKDVYGKGAFSIDYDMDNEMCVDGNNHKLVYREKSTEKKCGPYYIEDFYECEVCHKLFTDKTMTKRIRDTKEYIIDIPHEFKDYISDNNDSANNHGTMTANCIYGCGNTDTIYDTSPNMHHKYKKVIIEATMEKDGLITSTCELCNVVNPNENGLVIPHIKSISVEEEVEYDGKPSEAKIVVIDNVGNIVSNDNYDVIYRHNDNIGIANALIVFKNYYTNDDETDNTNFSYEYKIVPRKLKIKNVENDGKKLTISVDKGPGRINEVEIVVNDTYTKTIKKNDEDEYSIRLSEIGEKVKNIKIRAIRFDNASNEYLYSPYANWEVK